MPGSDGQALIDLAVQQLLESAGGPNAQVLWSLRYTQLGRAETRSAQPANPVERIIRLPPPSLDLAFDDALIDTVKDAWQAIMGDEATDHEFMTFEDREGAFEE